jgi:hypothetical protein
MDRCSERRPKPGFGCNSTGCHFGDSGAVPAEAEMPRSPSNAMKACKWQYNESLGRTRPTKPESRHEVWRFSGIVSGPPTLLG